MHKLLMIHKTNHQMFTGSFTEAIPGENDSQRMVFASKALLLCCRHLRHQNHCMLGSARASGDGAISKSDASLTEGSRKGERTFKRQIGAFDRGGILECVLGGEAWESCPHRSRGLPQKAGRDRC